MGYDTLVLITIQTIILDIHEREHQTVTGCHYIQSCIYILYTHTSYIYIRESVDSLCRDDMDTPIAYYILNASKLSNAWTLRLFR